MRKEEIEDYIEKKQKVSDRNFQTYQETGETRYLRNHERAEDEIEIARQALNSADDHTAALAYKADLIQIASRADRFLHGDTASGYVLILRDIVAAAKVAGYVSRWEEEK